MNDKKLKWITHDLDIGQSSAIAGIKRKYGQAGYGWYWFLIEQIAKQPGCIYVLKPWVFDFFADEFGISNSEVKKFIETLIEYELIQADEDLTAIWSDRVLIDLDNYIARSQKATDAANKRWKEKVEEQSDSTEDMPEVYAPSICHYIT